jgi:disulfide bond formation protein DsbB
MYLTTIVAIQAAIPERLIPAAIVVCSTLIFALFVMSLGVCVFSSEQNGPATVTNNRRLWLLLKGFAFSLICFWALFFNAVIRGMFSV